MVKIKEIDLYIVEAIWILFKEIELLINKFRFILF